MNTQMYENGHVDYLQIGAHIGNSSTDPIYHLDLTGKSMLLIEPVPFLFDILQHNYLIRPEIKSVQFLNIAISNYDGDINLIAPASTNQFQHYPRFLNEMASTTDEYMKKFRFSERFPDFKYETITVPCRRFQTVLQGMGITSIGHLIMDTEGHDHIILNDIDFNLIKPQKITFEHCYMQGQYDSISKYLISIGYQFVSEDVENTTFVLP